MKRIILLMTILAASFGLYAQGSLVMSAHANYITNKQHSDSLWGSWGTTNARFYLYKNGSVSTKVEAYFSSADNFTVATTFTVYAEEKINEDNGFAYYMYVYYSGDLGTSKTYDKSEYIKVKDEIKEKQSCLILVGYKNTTDWAWVFDASTTY